MSHRDDHGDREGTAVDESMEEVDDASFEWVEEESADERTQATCGSGVVDDHFRGEPDGEEGPDATHTEPDDGAPEVVIEDDPFDHLDDGESLPEDDPFTEMDVDTTALDEDVFEALDGSAASPVDTAVDEVAELEAADDGVIVPKRSYCERCQYYTEPPEASCTNPGTEIHELVDMEHYRVSNCPVVAERGAMGSSGAE